MNTFSSRTGRGAVAVVTVAGFTAVNALAGWWLIGDQSTVAPGQDADHVILPPSIPAGLEAGTGVACLLLVAAVVVVLSQVSWRRRVSARWWLVVPAVCLAGHLLAGMARTFTAGVVGANIGAGLAVFIAGPIVVVLLLWP